MCLVYVTSAAGADGACGAAPRTSGAAASIRAGRAIRRIGPPVDDPRNLTVIRNESSKVRIAGLSPGLTPSGAPVLEAYTPTGVPDGGGPLPDMVPCSS